MIIKVEGELEVNPGTIKTEEALKRDITARLEMAALGLGFQYGATEYQVQTADFK